MGMKWIDGKLQRVEEDYEWIDGKREKNPCGPSQCWQTPEWLFEILHSIFNFTVDAFANDANKLLPKFFTYAVADKWEGERAFCNPPFGFVEGFLYLGKKAEVSVWLLRVDTTTTDYFNESLPSWIVLPYKRVHYMSPGGKIEANTDFGSCLLIYGKATEGQLARLKEVGTVWKMVE